MRSSTPRRCRRTIFLVRTLLSLALFAAGTPRPAAADPETPSATAITAQWATFPGTVYTAPDQLAVPVVIAVCPEHYGSVSHVRFDILRNGSPFGLRTSYAPSIHVPNDTSTRAPIHGWPFPLPYPVFGYGHVFRMADLPEGEYSLTATVYVNTRSTSAGAQAGLDTFTLPDPFVFYNHRAGATPPSTRVIYCSPAAADDLGSGLTPATAVRTLAKAIHLAKVGDDAGGGKVIAMAGTHVGLGRAGRYLGNVFTSGHYFCEVVADPSAPPGSVRLIRAENDGPSDWLPVGGGANFRLKLRGLRLLDLAIVISAWSGCLPTIWVDGCDLTSPEGVFNARVFGRTGSWPVSIDGPQGEIWYTANTFHDSLNALGGFTRARDNRISRFVGQGINLGSVGSRRPRLVLNTQIEGQRYTAGSLPGVPAATPYTGIEIQVPAPGVMRIVDAASAHGPAFTAPWTLMAGHTRLGLQIVGTAANHGTYPILGTGPNWIDVANPGAVPEPSSGASTRSLFLAVLATGIRWHDAIHPDILKIEGDYENLVIAHLRSHDIANSQGLYDSSRDLRRVAFIDLLIATGASIGQSPLVGRYRDSVLWNCTFAGSVQFGTLEAPFDPLRPLRSKLEIRNTVFAGPVGFLPGRSAATLNPSYNHFVTAIPFGTFTTGGAFFLDPSALTSGNYRIAGSSAAYGTGGPGWTGFFLWSGDPLHRGAWSNTSSGVWFRLAFPET